MPIVRQALLMLARSEQVKRIVETMPVSAGIVRSYVPGETTPQAVEVARKLIGQGMTVTLDVLGEDTTNEADADKLVEAYLDLLEKLGDLAAKAEVSVKLTAIGLGLPNGREIALANAKRIAGAAEAVGARLTVDMEDHTVTDKTLDVVAALREEFPDSGTVLQAYLHRTEDDCRDLADTRIRLCKGAYNEPASVAYRDREQVRQAYITDMKTLMRGDGYPMIATHDPLMVQAALDYARKIGREKGTYEFQMLYGVRPEEQRRLVAEGESVRIYLPYGSEWYGYLMRRMAERPQNLALFLRSLISKK